MIRLPLSVDALNLTELGRYAFSIWSARPENHKKSMNAFLLDMACPDDFIVKKVGKTETNNIIPINRNEFLHKAGTLSLQKTKREWKSYDLLYWQEYGISLKTLEFFNVEPISHFFVNDKIITADKYAYCYVEFKDSKSTLKIYQPFSEKLKWLNLEL